MLWGCLTAERIEKSRKTVGSVVAGWRAGGGGECVVGAPPDDGNPFIVYGQLWLTREIVPDAVKARRPFYHIDNGYWRSARGGDVGYYRICYRGMSPVLLTDVDSARGERMGGPMQPWRREGGHVLLAMPGRDYGLALGIDVNGWCRNIESKIRCHTDRPIKIRERDATRPLASDLINCWALVTHSSNVATEAVCAGIPVFVKPTSPAGPVGNLKLAEIERPRMPSRRQWWNSLMCQQFSLREMANGTCYRLLSRVREQVDAELPVSA